MARTTRVLLLQGDYADRLEALGQAALAARDDKAPLLEGETHPYDVLNAEYEALKAEAERDAEAQDRAVDLRAIGRTKWRELRAKHPARTEGDGAEGDRLAGVNTESIEDDLVFATVSEPKFISRAAFDEWADELSEGEWQVLVAKSWELANGARLDPKSLPALPTRNTETS